jgi:hypothetical protein
LLALLSVVLVGVQYLLPALPQDEVCMKSAVTLLAIPIGEGDVAGGIRFLRDVDSARC